MLFKKDMAKRIQQILEEQKVDENKRGIVDIHFGFDNQALLDLVEQRAEKLKEKNYDQVK